MRRPALRCAIFATSILFAVGCNKSATTGNPGSNSPDGSSASTQSASDSYAGSNNGGAGEATNQKDSGSPVSRALAPKPIVIKAGTSLEVTVDQAVSSKDSNPGDHFEASFAEPVVVGDRVVIAKGTRAVGKVTDAKSAGRFKGNAAISVTLTSVTVDGKKYEVNTSEVTEAGKGRGKRTAIGAGGGAVVGGLIGALAGGGKGAAIGAGAGAGAGTAGTALTGDRDITIRPETRLRFRLEAPLEVRKN